MEETSLLITSTDKKEIAKILAFVVTETDKSKTRYVSTELKVPKLDGVDSNKDSDPSPTPALHNDTGDTRENGNTNVAENQTIGENSAIPNSVTPLIAVVKEEEQEGYIDGFPIDFMDEDVEQHIPLVQISDPPHVIPFVYKIGDDQSEISEEQEVMNNIVPPIDANLNDIDCEEAKPTVDESNNRCDNLESCEEQKVFDDIEQPIDGDLHGTTDVDHNENIPPMESDRNEDDTNLDNIEEVATDNIQSQCDNTPALAKNSTTMFKCEKCLEMIDLSDDMREKAKAHVYWHTGWMKYQCLDESCGKKFKSIDTAIEHQEKLHRGSKLRIKEIECDIESIHWEKKAKLKELIKDCFPGVYLNAYKLKRCEECLEEVDDHKGRLVEHGKKHAKLTSYTCSCFHCDFETKNEDAFKTHSNDVHGVHSENFRWMIKLTDSQKKDIIEQFFPATPLPVQSSNAQSSSTSYKRAHDSEKDLDYEERMIKRQKIDEQSKKYITCRKCLKVIENDKNTTREHAFSHSTHIYNLECSVDQCDRKTKYLSTMMNHHESTHQNIPFLLKLAQWSDEDCEEYRQTMKECFPNKEFAEYKCQLCYHFIIDTKSHVRHHLTFMKYKCSECPFESSSSAVIKRHGKQVHDKDLEAEALKVKLTREQEAEVKEVVKKCFPEE